MVREGTCELCGIVFERLRNPNQSYCSGKECQRERKNRWRRAKLKDDSDYHTNQKQANKRWQSRNQDYWRNYRASHPDYVLSNQEAQRLRDKNHRAHASHLAKSDALPEKNLVGSGSYWLIPIDADLAKSDALPLKIDLITRGYAQVHDLAKRPLYSLDG